RVVVDDHLVDLREAVRVGAGQLDVLHAEAPVGVPRRVAAVRGDLVDLLPVQHLVDDLEEVEAVLARVLLGALLESAELGGQGVGHSRTVLLRVLPGDCCAGTARACARAGHRRACGPPGLRAPFGRARLRGAFGAAGLRRVAPGRTAGTAPRPLPARAQPARSPAAAKPRRSPTKRSPAAAQPRRNPGRLSGPSRETP